MPGLSGLVVENSPRIEWRVIGLASIAETTETGVWSSHDD